MDTPDKSSLPENAINDILTRDRSALRFEDFCCDLLTVAEQVDYLPTSRSWDLGRDARTVPISGGSVALACCSITRKFEPKAHQDLTRSLEFVTPHSIHFCSSQPLTEKRVQEIEDELRRAAPQVANIAVLGVIQLTRQVVRTPKPFRTRYFAEILEYRDFLHGKGAQDRELQETGLRVALATQFHDDAQSLRRDLLRTLLLKAVSDRGRYSSRQLAKWISDALHLPKVIRPEFFADAIGELTNSGDLKLDDGQYSITDAGASRLKESDAVGENRLSKGRVLIRQRLNELLENELDDASFDVLWKRVQDEIATLFFFNGLRVLSAIASLDGGDPQPGPRKPLADVLEGIRQGIETTQIGGARAPEVAQAVIDLFDGQESELFAWLTDLAVKYVGICSLGLDPLAQQAMATQLQDIDLVIDTDVVLSFLSTGERPHATVEELLRRWVSFGGHVLITPPVLDECAYHAWISDHEYQDIWRDLSSLARSEVNRYAGNAFVRAFAAQCGGDFAPRRWNPFINEYRGSEPYDASKIIAILKEDESFDIVDQLSFDIFDMEFAKNVRNKIFELRKIDDRTYVPKAVGDKVWRDATLVGFLKARRSDPRFTDRTTVLVSSSPVLQRAASRFEAELGEPWPVWSIAAVTYLLALVPGVHMTMGTLRNCLFEEGDSDTMDRITRYALRVIRRSNEYTIGYSRRATLKRELKRNVGKLAKERGQRSSELEEELLESKAGSKELLTEVIAGAIDQLAASRSEREVEKLQKRR